LTTSPESFCQVNFLVLVESSREHIQTPPTPPDIISYAAWLYYRFIRSHRRSAGPFIEELLAERGITVSREAVRLWCIKFGALYARRLKRKHRGYGETFFIDEVIAGVPDHSDERQAALTVAGRRPGL
jgi:transposase-like protein